MGGLCGEVWNNPLMHEALYHGQSINVVSRLLCVLLKLVIKYKTDNFDAKNATITDQRPTHDTILKDIVTGSRYI